jgi:uncharacterized protein (TIGR00251 family)
MTAHPSPDSLSHQQLLSCRESSLEELQVVEAIYYQHKEFQLISSPAVIQLIKQQIQQKISEFCTESLVYIVNLTCNLENGSSASICSVTSTIPSDYPLNSRPSLFSRSELFNREQLEHFNQKVKQFIQTQPEGEICVLNSLEFIKAEFELFLSERSALADKLAAVNPQSTVSRAVFMRSFLYFHHIYSSHKRKFVLSCAQSFGISGIMKIGKPGIIIAEGLADDCRQFIAEIRALSWQKMTERFSTLHERAIHSLSEQQVFLLENRKFHSFLELQPKSERYPTMNLLLELMKNVNLQEDVRQLIGLESAETNEEEANSCEEEESKIPAVLSAKGFKKSAACSNSPASGSNSKAKSAAATPSAGCAPVYSFLRAVSEGVLLSVAVKPNASATEILAFSSGESALPLRLAAPAKENAANEALIELLAGKVLKGVVKGRKSVEIVAGERSKEKQVLIKGAEIGAIAQHLYHSLQQLHIK